MLDLDHFKNINDTHGHAVGDRVLNQVGELIKENCRENDIAVRFGGEEFVCLFPNCEKGHAENKAEYLRKKIQSLTPEGIAITASVGVTCIKDYDVSSLDTVLEIADKALYKAKNTGRNKVCSIDFSNSTN